MSPCASWGKSTVKSGVQNVVYKIHAAPTPIKDSTSTIAHSPTAHSVFSKGNNHQKLTNPPTTQCVSSPPSLPSRLPRLLPPRLRDGPRWIRSACRRRTMLAAITWSCTAATRRLTRPLATAMSRRTRVFLVAFSMAPVSSMNAPSCRWHFVRIIF